MDVTLTDALAEELSDTLDAVCSRRTARPLGGSRASLSQLLR